MSWQAQAWVWGITDISPLEKLIALSFANYASPLDGGGIRPGIDRIARETGASEKTVRRARDALLSRGYLIEVVAPKGAGHCGVYRMPAADCKSKDCYPKEKVVTQTTIAGEGGHTVREWWSDSPEKVVTQSVNGGHSDRLTLREPVLEPLVQPNAREGALGSDINAENYRIKSSWEEWWEAYPRKDAKPAAEKAYRKALKSVGADVLLTSLRRYQFSAERKFTPYPATWLHGRYWENEQDDPTDDWGLRAWKAKQPAIADGSLFAASGYETDALLEIMAASGLDPKWRGDLDVLSGWLEGGYRPDSLCEVLAEAYGRNGAPRSLRSLDGLVRARAVFYDPARMCWRRRSER